MAKSINRSIGEELQKIKEYFSHIELFRGYHVSLNICNKSKGSDTCGWMLLCFPAGFICHQFFIFGDENA